MSKSFTLSISVLLIFKIQIINGTLCLKAIFWSKAALFGSVTVIIVPLKTMYTCL